MKKISQTGSVLISVIIVLPFLIMIAATYMSLSTTSLRLAYVDKSHTNAQFATDAGIDYGLQQINANGAWTGTGGEIELQNTSGVRTTYQLTVTDVDADSKTLTSIGRTYRPATAITPEASVTILVDLRSITTGLFSIVSGVGGLIMTNSAKVVGGDVLVNGEITLSNTAQIGLSGNPVNVEVAHQTCPNPANASYPQICGLGENGQPITINNTAHIYGDVKANNQTTTTGMSDPGLTASSGVSAQSLPPHDRDAQKAAVATTITGAAASCNGSQTRTWAANTKITGDVSVSNNCIVTVLGDVWITGEFEMKNSTQMIVDNSLGTTRPSIMVDDPDGAEFSNSAKLVSNSSSTGFQVIAYYSRASCSPDCADVTGVDLYNSRNDITVKLDNSAEGPNSIFYSKWTRVQIANSGQIGALVGQTVELKNSSTITFGTSIGTGSTYWIIDGYRRSF
ncbi:MAG: hypothetical protein AAB459_02865 [Patescibacteria group bacterium]